MMHAESGRLRFVAFFLKMARMTGEAGLEIVLTPLQLAAVLENDTIEESASLANTFWGAVTAVGGAIELVGAAALFLTPEPTMVTKLAGGALALHGSDTASAGMVQFITGRTRTTLTSQAAMAAAAALGADGGTAATVGMAVEIAVPLVAGFAGAARVLAVRKGAVTLFAEEAAGGHTIARHVGRTEAQLRARLAAEAKIPAATSFRTLQEAERSVTLCLRANKVAVKEWGKVALAGQTKSFTFNVGTTIGYGVVRSTNSVQDMTHVIVVLRKVSLQNRIYFVLTSYPKPF